MMMMSQTQNRERVLNKSSKRKEDAQKSGIQQTTKPNEYAFTMNMMARKECSSTSASDGWRKRMWTIGCVKLKTRAHRRHLHLIRAKDIKEVKEEEIKIAELRNIYMYILMPLFSVA